MANLKMLFKDAKPKALTLSYDDGVEQDKKLISIMVKNGLKGTFNLNSGAYAPEGTVYEPGTIHRRMPETEVTALYSKHGMEVALHGLTHPGLTSLPANLATYEVIEDRRRLEKQFNCIVRGAAYPYGAYNDSVIDILKNCGIAYARTVESTHSFWLPGDWLKLPATCHHNDPELMKLADEFLNLNEWRFPALFYLWGHSYEFDEKNNWEVIENFAEKMGGKKDIWYATNIEIYDYVEAFKSLRFSTDMTLVYNPTALPVWFEYAEKTYEVEPGMTIAM